MKLTFNTQENAAQAWHDIETAGIKIEGPRHAYQESPTTILVQDLFQGGWFNRFVLPARSPTP
jgi:hypothetical protein